MEIREDEEKMRNVKMKQLFCHHVWKKTQRELIDEYHEMIMRGVPWHSVKVYAIHFECIKCKKTTIEKRESVSNPTDW